MKIEEINALGKICGIYKITSPSNKIYIGSSSNIKKRWNSYFYLKCKLQPKIYNSLKKYGSENHIYEIIEECEFEVLYERERYYQELYDCLGVNSLNCNLVETNSKKRVCSQEMRAKMSKIKKERIVTTETKNKLSIIQKRLQLNSKKVVCLSTGKIFNSILEVSKLNNINYRTLSYHLNRGNDVGYKLLDFQGYFREKKKGNKISIKHIPTQMIFYSISEAALYFSKYQGYISKILKNNSSTNEFEYLDKEMQPKKKGNKKPIIHLETNLKFESMREAEIYFNYKKGYIKSTIRGKSSKFKIIE